MSDREEFEEALRLYFSEHAIGSTGLIRKVAGHFYDLRQPEIDALQEKQRLFEADNAILRAEIDALKAEVNRHHEAIMRQKVLLEQANDVIGQYAPGFSILLNDIEISLYGEILSEGTKDPAAMKEKL